MSTILDIIVTLGLWHHVLAVGKYPRCGDRLRVALCLWDSEHLLVVGAYAGRGEEFRVTPGLWEHMLRLIMLGGEPQACASRHAHSMPMWSRAAMLSFCGAVGLLWYWWAKLCLCRPGPTSQAPGAPNANAHWPHKMPNP